MTDIKGIRNAGRDIYTVNFADYLPGALKQDPKIRAIAEAVAKEALAVSGEIENVLIYSRIDKLPEELIDILAYDMHVDWYEYSYPIETKRNILKSSVKVHKKMGTKYAVEKALSDVYRTAAVAEWFDYGGKPYHFKVTVDIGDMGLSEETTRQIEEKMWFYKNLRSHCDGIFYAISTKRAEVAATGVHELGVKLKVKPLLKNNIKTAGKQDIRAATFFAIKLKVKPILPGGIAAKTRNAIQADLRTLNRLKVKTYTESEMKANLAAQTSVEVYLRSKQTMTIKKER